MEIDTDLLPSKFLELYSLAEEVNNGCQSGKLSYQLLYVSQKMISLYVSLVKSTKIQNTSYSQFDKMIQNYKDLISNIKQVASASVLLTLGQLSLSILNNLENTINLTKRNVSLRKYSLKVRLLSDFHLNLVYMTRLAVTYQKYFDDKYIRKSNMVWRQYAPLLDMNPIILEFPQATKVLAGSNWNLYMMYLSQKLDAVIGEIQSLASSIEPLIKYESPNSPDYKNDFTQIFAKNAVDVSIPIPLKEREEEASEV